MKDTWGLELSIGDEVCVVRKQTRYVNTYFGTIIGFTPSGHLAKIIDKTGHEWLAGERIFKRPKELDSIC
jgi:hypothetical protein